MISPNTRGHHRHSSLLPFGERLQTPPPRAHSHHWRAVPRGPPSRTRLQEAQGGRSLWPRAGGSKVLPEPEAAEASPRERWQGQPYQRLVPPRARGTKPWRSQQPAARPRAQGPGQVRAAQQAPTPGHGPPVQPSPNAPPKGPPCCPQPLSDWRRRAGPRESAFNGTSDRVLPTARPPGARTGPDSGV